MSEGAASVETGRIRTRIPARLDRLPWSRFHWLVVFGLGTVWILDGLEVTIVGSVAARLTQHGSGITISTAQIGTAAAFYVGGACLGALFFGQLTDRFGRKKLFMITLGLYMVATAATAFSWTAWYFFIARFFTGAGIGGEYAAINSAIDELIPARVRGRVDLIINGSFWAGSIIGSALAILLLDTAYLPKDIGWRVAFAIGVVLALGVLLVRRNVPESPRWLFIHGREEEAERIVRDIEAGIENETGQELEEPEDELVVRQRETIPFREIAKVAFKKYPHRAVLALALFVGQAFIYNGITFNLGTLFTTFYKVSSGFVPVFIIAYAAANFLGPLTLGRLFDTVGRKPMITATYLGSAAVAFALAPLFAGGFLSSPWHLEAFVMGAFFLASAGASAAYLTASEIFPMETRALAIAFFYAIGTAIGGVTGPLLFGRLIGSGSRHEVAIAFYIGAAVMALGGIVEMFWGVRAERRSLEDIAKPLTVEEAERDEAGEEGVATDGETAARAHPERRKALAAREEAEEVRARASEHRAHVHELRASEGSEASRAEIEETLAAIGDVYAESLEQRAAAHEGFAAADEVEGTERDAALERARAAEERAGALEQQASALGAENDEEERQHAELSEAARERARAREQRAAAQEARAEAEGLDGGDAQVASARSDARERWAELHDERALLHERLADGDEDGAGEHDRRAAAAQERALAAEERIREAEHLAAAAEVRSEHEEAAQEATAREQAAERERRREEAERRIRERIARREQRERQGLRRYRPGPGGGETFFSPGMLGTAASTRGRRDEWALDREIEVIAHALDENGETDRRELAQLVGARYWGPGRFREALNEAVEEGRIRRLGRRTYGPA